MTEYAFPRDLLEAIKVRWKTVRDQQFELPEDRVLRRLLETCYHASFRTSEQRAVRCVVAYVSVAEIPEGALLLTNLSLLLTDTELVRLSPVTQRRQTVIGCEDLDGWLRIWGFFEYGHAWVQHSAGDPPAVPIQPTDFPPNCLAITIESPGALTISRGRIALVKLRDGRIIFPQESLLQATQSPLGKFFQQLIGDLHIVDESVGRRSLLDIYTTSVLAILERIRLRQHGGSVVITRVPFDVQLAHITYTVTEHAGLVGKIVAYKALDDSLRQPLSHIDADAELVRCQAEVALRQSSEQLIRGINQISLLAAVDGAVLLDNHLRLQGFGVRFPMLLPPQTAIIDAQTGTKYACEQWGLRHQSIFSICHKCEQAIGLIVSQDGEVKAVKADEDRLFFWEGILD